VEITRKITAVDDEERYQRELDHFDMFLDTRMIPDETIDEFATRFQIIAEASFEGDVTQERKVRHQFVRALLPYLREKIEQDKTSMFNTTGLDMPWDRLIAAAKNYARKEAREKRDFSTPTVVDISTAAGATTTRYAPNPSPHVMRETFNRFTQNNSFPTRNNNNQTETSELTNPDGVVQQQSNNINNFPMNNPHGEYPSWGYPSQYPPQYPSQYPTQYPFNQVTPWTQQQTYPTPWAQQQTYPPIQTGAPMTGPPWVNNQLPCQTMGAPVAQPSPQSPTNSHPNVQSNSRRGRPNTQGNRQQQQARTSVSGANATPIPSSTSTPWNARKYCQFCGQNGHMMNECEDRPLCEFCHKRGHVRRDCWQELGVCARCRQPGHTPAECPLGRAQAVKRCPFCKQEDHIGKDCPKLAKN
jgi:ribosomal protein S9